MPDHFLRVPPGKMNKENISRITAEEILAKRYKGDASQTDIARVNALTDEDIKLAMRDDPDWADFIDIDWSKAEWVRSTQVMRLDADHGAFAARFPVTNIIFL